jgi:hypothetical protein
VGKVLITIFENHVLIFHIIMLQKWVFKTIFIQIVQLVTVIFACDFKWGGWTERGGREERGREAYTHTD